MKVKLFFFSSLVIAVFLVSMSVRTFNESAVAASQNEDAESNIARLAAQQLDAYNRADLDAFCDCYHPEVRVFDGEMEKTQGIEAFRERYVEMFAKGGFSAKVSARVVHAGHCIDLEHWQRSNGKSGTVLVRYTEKDGRIGIVQFLG